MRRLVLASLALTSAGVVVQAQGLGDPLISAAITQSFVADTNFTLDDPNPGTSYYADTRFILDLLNETPTQAFALNLDTGLRALWQAEEDFEFTFASPTTGRVDFDQEWANGSIETYLRYRQREVNSTTVEFVDNPVDGALDDISEETETDSIERRYDGGFELAIATDSPSSYELNFVGTRFDYSEEAEDETPRTTLLGDAAWLLRFSPVLSGVLGAGYYYYTADNDEETEIRQAEIRRRLRLRRQRGAGTARRGRLRELHPRGIRRRRRPAPDRARRQRFRAARRAGLRIRGRRVPGERSPDRRGAARPGCRATCARSIRCPAAG